MAASLCSSSVERVEFYLIVCKSIVTILLVLFIQISWMKSQYKMLVPVFLIDLLFILSAHSLGLTLQIIMMMSLMPIIFGLITLLYKKEDRLTGEKIFARRKVESRANEYQSIPHFRIQIKNLIANSSQLSMVSSALALMAVLTVFLIVYGKNNPHFQLMLSTIFLINALSVSNLFKRMDVQWDEFHGFIRSLPMTKMQLACVNLIITTSITLFINAALLVTSNIVGGYSMVSFPSLVHPLRRHA